jgi:hypothetical protein
VGGASGETDPPTVRGYGRLDGKHMIKRIFIFGAAALMAFGMTMGAAHAKGAKGAEASTAEITVVFDGASVEVESSKDISNIVLEFCDGTTQRFVGLSGLTGSFSGTGENSGKILKGVWVKSGDNKSGDGPGYGEYFASGAECSGPSEITEVEPTLPAVEATPPANNASPPQGNTQPEVRSNNQSANTVRVTDDSVEVLGGAEQKADEKPAVLGANFTQTGSLPMTGLAAPASVPAILMLASSLMALGCLMVRFHNLRGQGA